ncbi:hypothetical protein JOD45_003026 [Scopulibacillus daqui]|uniref:Small acid-soluble spore protein L (Minor) n=1 Tax=Scopulibacillus daqui TaxID=1469162 RepID=A0ABS2Q5L9_9BACL|nr:hypothetical protein [Scopulibacillus daqui]
MGRDKVKTQMPKAQPVQPSQDIKQAAMNKKQPKGTSEK